MNSPAADFQLLVVMLAEGKEVDAESVDVVCADAGMDHEDLDACVEVLRAHFGTDDSPEADFAEAVAAMAVGIGLPAAGVEAACIAAGKTLDDLEGSVHRRQIAAGGEPTPIAGLLIAG